MSALETLVDDFTTKGIDTSKWETTYAGADVPETGGLEIELDASPAYNFVQSLEEFDLTDSSIFGRFDEMPSSDLSGGFNFLVHSLANTNRRAAFYWETGTLYAHVRDDVGTDTVVWSATYSATTHAWWRIRHESGTAYWDTSTDGSAWTNRGSATLAGFTDAQVYMELGYWSATPTPAGKVQIGRLNTVGEINTETLIDEDFDAMPVGVLPVLSTWGHFWNEDDSGDPDSVQIAAVSGGRALYLSPTTDNVAVVRTHQWTPVADVDFTMEVRVEDFRAATPPDEASVSVMWRYVDQLNHYRLQIYEGYALVWRVVEGTFTHLRTIGVGVEETRAYTYRVVHAGGVIVIYRDSGGFGPLTELDRFAEETFTTPGEVAVLAFMADVYVDDVVMDNGDAPASLPDGAARIKDRRWGTFVEDADGVDLVEDISVLTSLEALVGKRFDIASFFLAHDDLPSTPQLEALSTGRELLVSFGPDGWDMADIIAGTHDAALENLAGIFAALPGPSVIRLMPEMNGEWSPWSVEFDAAGTGTDPAKDCNVTDHAQWVTGWQHIVQTFVDAGATRDKVRWMFCINETDEPRTDHWERYYPGDAWVDLLGFDSYNWGTGGPHVWRDHGQVLGSGYYRMAGFQLDKPIWCAEFACKEPTKSDGAPTDPSNSKGDWVRALMGDKGFARLEAFAWFSIEKERDWRMESS